MNTKLTIVAKVLWVDHRDENGIVVDDFGNEYYIDVSACKRRELPLRNQLVRGEYVKRGETLCLTNVRSSME